MQKLITDKSLERGCNYILYNKSWTGLIARVDTHNGVVGLTHNPFMGRDSTLSLYRTRSQTKGAEGGNSGSGDAMHTQLVYEHTTSSYH